MLHVIMIHSPYPDQTLADDAAILEAISQIEKEISPSGSSDSSLLFLASHPATLTIVLGLIVAVVVAKAIGKIP